MLARLPVMMGLALAATLSGCASAGKDHAATLAGIDLPNRYAAAPADAGPAVRCDRSSWPGLFGDELLSDLAGRAAPASAQADVATGYVVVRLNQARITEAHARLARLSDLQQLALYRARAGLVTDRDRLQIEAEQARIAATLPLLDAAILSAAARIAVLTGTGPEDVHARLAAPAAIPAGPAYIGVGQPADLIAQRDDVRAATRWFDATGWLPGGSKASARKYRRSILLAQAEVETALAGFEGAKAREVALLEAIARSEALADLVRRQYRDGLADYTALAAVDSMLDSTRGDLNEARAARARSLIALCLALGRDRAEGTDNGG